MPFTKPELIDAVTKLFKDNDRTRIVSMLSETFVLKIPETLPYGGSFQGAGEFDRYFKSIYEDHSFWSSFRTELSVGRVLDAGSYLVAPLRVTARAKSSGATITVENLWLFEVADGNFVRAQLYADTAAGRNVAGLGPQPDAAVLGGDAKTHNPAPIGDATVADESEFFEQALWPGMKVGAALRVTSNHLLGVGLDQASASLRTPSQHRGQLVDGALVHVTEFGLAVAHYGAVLADALGMKADAPAATPDKVVCLNQSGEVLQGIGREQTRRVLGRGLPEASRSSGHAGSAFLRMDLGLADTASHDQSAARPHCDGERIAVRCYRGGQRAARSVLARLPRFCSLLAVSAASPGRSGFSRGSAVHARVRTDGHPSGRLLRTGRARRRRSPSA
jgi:hypothetical protein